MAYTVGANTVVIDDFGRFAHQSGIITASSLESFSQTTVPENINRALVNIGESDLVGYVRVDSSTPIDGTNVIGSVSARWRKATFTSQDMASIVSSALATVDTSINVVTTGTFVPVLRTISDVSRLQFTGVTATGLYVRNGPVVEFNVDITATPSSITSSPIDTVGITQLPLVSAAGSGIQGGGHITFTKGIDWQFYNSDNSPGPAANIGFHIGSGVSFGTFFISPSYPVLANATNSDFLALRQTRFTTGRQVRIAMTGKYFIQ